MRHHNSSDINSLIICGPGQPQHTQPPHQTFEWDLLQRDHTSPERLTVKHYRRLQSCTAVNHYNWVICLLDDLYTMWTQGRSSQNSVPTFPQLHRMKQDGSHSIYNLSSHSGHPPPPRKSDVSYNFVLL